jgi:hypothetical protein
MVSFLVSAFGSLRGTRRRGKWSAPRASAQSVLCCPDSSGARTSRLERSGNDGSGLFDGDVEEASSGDSFVPADSSTELDARRRQYSEREAQGHERAAAVVHPI